jgi:hypothetical protein
MSGDLEKLAETVGKVVAANMKAQASVMVAVLSTSVKQKLLSVEIVENQILKALRESYESLSKKSAPESADKDEAEAALQLVGIIRQRLLREGD